VSDKRCCNVGILPLLLDEKTPANRTHCCFRLDASACNAALDSLLLRDGNPRQSCQQVRLLDQRAGHGVDRSLALLVAVCGCCVVIGVLIAWTLSTDAELELARGCIDLPGCTRFRERARYALMRSPSQRHGVEAWLAPC
jgi:hypothetical protein